MIYYVYGREGGDVHVHIFVCVNRLIDQSIDLVLCLTHTLYKCKMTDRIN